MKRAISIALISVAALVAMVPGSAVAEAATSAAAAATAKTDEAKIRKLFADLMDAVTRENTQDVIKAYAPKGFVYLDVSTPRAFYGREGAGKTWDAWFSFIEPGSGTGEATDLQVTVVGDYAFAMHFDRYTAKPKDASFKHLRDFTNRATSWLHKIDGQWYILVEHNSFPVDLATKITDFESKK